MPSNGVGFLNQTEKGKAMRFNLQTVRTLSAAALVGAFSAAQAAVDVTAATTEIADSKTAVLQIGLAVFGVAVGIKLYKWLKTAL